MNITTFYPAVFVDDMDAALTKYEDMGFSRIHMMSFPRAGRCEENSLRIYSIR